MTAEMRTETATQLIHKEFHPAGYASACNRCRSVAESIDRLYEKPEEVTGDAWSRWEAE